ncbi:hypothetical protein GCM10007304_08040 [Rhodococcoides trifolii]|uniref:CHRD domain-containing protein n=1 Tax=Rhodococcoides trifolii TaxID=908250 RepID=A0A917CRR1_9NOCA|nr:CHRD domain-containing protein [Rhodococcus trifolii]GGF96471.1 hypothetical protein GCM10007304_08040 [Rhodococcus trifolii]
MSKFKISGAVALAASAAMVFGAGTASAETTVAAPATFTSAFTSVATPNQVLNAQGVATPGQPGALGSFTYRINSDLDIICYDIFLAGVTDDYMSPAKTATHIHQAAAGVAGPPRIAFPNPTDIGNGLRQSSGCLQGPFTTGVVANGADTGTDFDLTSIEANPAGFAADTHTTAFTAGAVRGQLTPIPFVGKGGFGSS